MHEWLYFVRQAIRVDAICGLLTFRLVPFVGHAIVARDVSLSLRTFWIAAVGLPLTYLALHGVSPLRAILPTVLVLACLALVAYAVHFAAFALSRRRVRRSTILVGLLLTCLVLPGALCPPMLVAPAIVLGFEVFLSSYSYCVDNDLATARPPASECLTFILVNPQLVYAERGIQQPSFRARAHGLGRCLLGIAAWCASDVALAGAPRSVPASSLHMASAVGDYSRLMHLYVIQFVAYYFMHSGLASVQIGLAAVHGYRLPERYNYAFLARTPREFWERWNIWVGSWARRYIFAPTNLMLRRGGGMFRHRNGAAALATLVTFGCIGLVHDLAAVAQQSFVLVDRWSAVRGTLLFLFYGATFVVWVAIQRVTSRITPGSVLPRWATLAFVPALTALVLCLALAEHAVACLLTHQPPGLRGL